MIDDGSGCSGRSSALIASQGFLSSGPKGGHMSAKTRAAVPHATIPKTMHAMAIDRFGGPEGLSMHTLPVPVPNANEVLIAVNNAEVGGWDGGMRSGWWP